MNDIIKDFDRVNENFQDDWLNDNLKLIQAEPPLDFTKKVMEKVEVKPNPLSNSPIFWILTLVPGVFIVWLIIYALNILSVTYHFNLHFLPNSSSLISLTSLSKYLIMVVIGGLLFIGLDYFLNKQILQKQSFFSILVV